MINVDVQSKSYGNTQVLRDIHLSLERGDALAILGASGIGKTTLLRIIAGIDTKYDGVIERPENIGIVFQEPTLLPWRSVFDNIKLVHPSRTNDAIHAMLRDVGLSGKAEMFPGQLSLGQQRRLSLARGFAGQPELLILDEPFVSLDQATADDMLSLTKRLIDKTEPTTIFVTHNMAEAATLATQVMTLQGEPATLHNGGDPQ
ncbi:ABC transporter ATP-binding protein [Loktanella sp. S4079]|uniref:ABC transporter ATP-binding protein n=1 Tax=Loktanella sp. S4079 TaxID=579483 RepID=UPI0005FA8245|nr:ABC transporter ATP-binding protein [Loktanella sp. S4079]KJZ18224.1 ABC transporter ATP-binding protein [Loktanella sp. S4079]